MDNSMMRALALILCCSVVAGAQEQPPNLEQAVGAPQVKEQRPAGPEPPSDPVEAALASLNLDQRIAQLLLVTFNGLYSPNNEDRALLRAVAPGGVVIPVLAKPSDGARYIAALRAHPTERDANIPMLIAGNIYSLTQHDLIRKAVFPQLPSPLSIAAAGDTDATKRLFTLIARYMQVMGFNAHMGPSLALATTVPGARGTLDDFGGDPRVVARIGVLLHEGLSAHGVLAMATGFPGGGANRVRNDPAVLLTPRAQLRERDLLPYIESVNAGVKLVLVGNTLAPTIDRNALPSSVSPIIMRDLLRIGLNFDGIVVAGPVDDQDMAKHFQPVEAAIRAIEAGADMLFVWFGAPRAAQLITGLAQAVREGRIDEAHITNACRRVLAFKREAGLLDRPGPDVKEAEKLEKEFSKFDETYQIERRSITLVKNSGDLLPLTKQASMPIGVTGVVGVEELRDALEKYIKPIAMQRITTASHIGQVPTFEVDRVTRYVKGVNTAICVFSSEISGRGQADVVRGLKEKGGRVVVVLLGYPDRLSEFKDADAIVLAYTPPVSPESTMRAVADVLVGNAPFEVMPALRDLRASVNQAISFNVTDVVRSPTGRLPGDIEPPYVTGYSVTYNPILALNKVIWDFGDGKRSKELQNSHAFAQPGRYTVTLTVTDQLGIAVSGTFHVVVE